MRMPGTEDRVLLSDGAERGEEGLGLGDKPLRIAAGGEAVGDEGGGLIEERLPLAARSGWAASSWEANFSSSVKRVRERSRFAWAAES